MATICCKKELRQPLFQGNPCLLALPFVQLHRATAGLSHVLPSSRHGDGGQVPVDDRKPHMSLMWFELAFFRS